MWSVKGKPGIDHPGSSHLRENQGYTILHCKAQTWIHTSSVLWSFWKTIDTLSMPMSSQGKLRGISSLLWSVKGKPGNIIISMINYRKARGTSPALCLAKEILSEG